MQLYSTLLLLLIDKRTQGPKNLVTDNKSDFLYAWDVIGSQKISLINDIVVYWLKDEPPGGSIPSTIDFEVLLLGLKIIENG